jgi:pSer/pThr/pTyr-binding forkhead associated (FHA) protein
MLAIAVNALYTTLRKRGTTRQLAGTIVACVISALLLLPAIFWYNMRFSSPQAVISGLEVTVALIYVALWGWLLPLSLTTIYCLFTHPRDSHTSVHIPRLRNPRKRTTRGNAIAGIVTLPRRQPGAPAPFVFGVDIPWGWLVHRSGRFQGQKLALNRTVISIGREEDNDIWLDDDTSSRYHAELAWDAGQVYITDCDSLNGVILNGRRIRGTLVIKSGDLLEIGSHRFLFEKAEHPIPPAEQDDPLSHHQWRLSITPHPAIPGQFDRKPPSFNASPTKPMEEETPLEFDSLKVERVVHQLSAGLNPITPPLLPERPGSLCVICNGEMVGRSFLLDRLVLTIGQADACDVIIRDASISGQHARFLHQVSGDYLQDLTNSNGTKVNDEPLNEPRLLQEGDIINLGNIRLEYTSIPEAQTTSLPPLSTQSKSGPLPLRLPSKPK